MSARTRLVGAAVVLVLSLGCAESQCRTPPDAPPVDTGLDTSISCRGGRVVVGPVGGADGCAAYGDLLLDYWVFDERSSPVAFGTFDCRHGETSFFDVGVLPPGDYRLSAEGPRGATFAGGENIRAAECAEIAASMPWLSPACSPIELEVRNCDTTIVPLLLYPGLSP